MKLGIMCCNGSACVESLMQISLYNKVCKEMQYIYAVFCFLKLSTYLLTPPRTLKPIFSVIISSILSNWPSILWWTNSLTAEFNISPFATTLWKGNAQLKKKKSELWCKLLQFPLSSPVFLMLPIYYIYFFSMSKLVIYLNCVFNPK